MLVQAIDEKLYNNPTIIGENYYFKITEIDPITLYLKHNNRMTLNSAKKRARKALKTLSINGILIEDRWDIDRHPFPPNWEMSVGYSFEIKLKGPIPIPTFDEGVVDYPSTTSPYIAWSLRFNVSEIKDAINGNSEWSPLLLGFLINQPIIEDKETLEEAEKFAKRKIIRQYRDIHRLTLEETMKKYGEKLVLRRKFSNNKGID